MAFRSILAAAFALLAGLAFAPTEARAAELGPDQAYRSTAALLAGPALTAAELATPAHHHRRFRRHGYGPRHFGHRKFGHRKFGPRRFGRGRFLFRKRFGHRPFRKRFFKRRHGYYY